jgi:hypothetical protein
MVRRVSMQIEATPESSNPPPIQYCRSGKFQRASFSDQVSPWSFDRNSAPGIVPHQIQPG